MKDSASSTVVCKSPTKLPASHGFLKFVFSTLLSLILISGLFAEVTLQKVEAAPGVPYAFSYQGRLSNSSGVLLGGAGTTYCFRFSLWDNPTPGSGTRLWPAGTPGNTQLTVKYGVFSANIGIDTADALTFNFYDSDAAHLQVEVATYSGSCGTFETLAPRKRMVASGYAINSDLLDGADSGTAANNILKLDASGNIGLTASNPSVRASSTNTLTVQGGGATGDLQFFSGSNRITSAGALTLAGGATLGAGLVATTGGFTGALTGTSATFSSASGVTLGAASTANGRLVFLNSTNANTLTIEAGATSSSYALILPTAQGAAGTVLKNDGSGILSWATACDNCILNNGSASNTTNAISPTADIVSLQIRQTSASSPSSDIFQVENNAGTAQYLSVASTGAVTLAPSAGQALFMNLAAGAQARVVATAAPTNNLFEVSNSGQATTTANANGIRVDYVGGAAAVEGSGVRIDVNPGSTSGGTWNGMRFVANATGPVSGVALNAIKLDGPSSPGAGTETAINIGSGWDVGLSIQSGGITLTEIADQTSPAADTLRLYASDFGGKTFVKVKDSTGSASSLQPSIYENNVAIIAPNDGISLSTLGTGTISSGTLSHPAATQATGFMTNFESDASIGDVAGTATVGANYFRGSTAGSNGFFYFARLHFPDSLASYANTTTGSRVFVGLTNQAMSASVGSDDPAGHRAGFSLVPSRDTSDFNWKFSTKDGATESVANLGVAFAAAKTYDFYIYVAPQGGTVYYRLDNLTDNVSTSGSTSSNLPDGSTALRAGFQIATLNAVAKNVKMQRIYIATDR